MIPSVAVIRIDSEHFRCPAIPLPLFLLWAIVLVLSPLILVALLVVWVVCLAYGFPLGRALVTFWKILCALPGTDVRVTAEGKHITVRIL